MSTNPVVAHLSRAKLFAGLNSEEMSSLASCFSEQEFSIDQILIRQSEISNQVYVITEGTVEVVIDLIGGSNEAMIASLGPGDTVGEFALVGSSRRSASALAKSKTVRVLVGQRDEMIAFFGKNPQIGYVVFRNLSAVLVDRLINLNMFTRTTLSQYQQKRN